MDEKEVYEEGLTFKELFQYIWKKKIVGLIIVIVTFLVSFGAMALYSDKNAVYQSTFDLKWSGIERQKYPDGASFSYRDIISKENVAYVLEHEEGLDYLNCEDLLSNNNLTVEHTISYIDNENKDLGTHSTFIVTSSTGKFKNKNDAKHFVAALVERQKDIIENKADAFKFDTALKNIDDTVEYDEVFKNIEMQLNRLHDFLDNILKERKSDFVYDLSTKSSLRSLLNEIDNMISIYRRNTISMEYISNKYVRNQETAPAKFQSEMVALTNTIAKNKDFLTLLKQSTGEFSSEEYNKIIVPIVKETIDLEYRLKYITEDPMVPFTYNDAYDQRVKKLISQVDEITETVNLAQRALAKDSIVLSFASHDIVAKVSFGLMKSVILSVVIAIVFGFVVLLLMALFSKPRKAAIETTSEVLDVEAPVVQEEVKETKEVKKTSKAKKE